jgi:hypothetical protein
MSSAIRNSFHIARAVAPIAAALVVISLGATPSSARPDPGPHIPVTGHSSGCQLQPVGTEFVRCDNPTEPLRAHVAVAASDRFTLEPDGTLLPGDVRVWELNHPAGVTPAPLPGDLRLRERGGPGDPSAPVT